MRWSRSWIIQSKCSAQDVASQRALVFAVAQGVVAMTEEPEDRADGDDQDSVGIA